jgi:hypothetical protein
MAITGHRIFQIAQREASGLSTVSYAMLHILHGISVLLALKVTLLLCEYFFYRFLRYWHAGYIMVARKRVTDQCNCNCAMDSFKLPLSNGAIVTGIRNIPPRSTTNPKYRPLIVGLHGGTYDCHYFDADPKYTASTLSNIFGVPFVSIDRPCYGGTSSFLPLQPGTNFPEETASRLHRYILPALWSEFGEPNECNCIIFLCHSLGGMPGIIVGALYAQDSQPAYPLGGTIVSGMGDTQTPSAIENRILGPNHPSDRVTYPIEA